MAKHDAPVDIRRGIPEAMRSSAAELYDEAFGAKFAVAISSQKLRKSLLVKSLNLDFAFAAIQGNRLVGLAGFKTPEGSFTGGMTYARLIETAGFLRGNWAALVFSFYERGRAPGQLLMDGIVVDASARGQGIGTQLLAALAEFGASNGFESLRLDVIDTNPDARRMYERNDFVATRTQNFAYLRWLFGFGATTTMVRQTSGKSGSSNADSNHNN